MDPKHRGIRRADALASLVRRFGAESFHIPGLGFWGVWGLGVWGLGFGGLGV